MVCLDILVLVLGFFLFFAVEYINRLNLWLKSLWRYKNGHEKGKRPNGNPLRAESICYNSIPGKYKATRALVPSFKVFLMFDMTVCSITASQHLGGQGRRSASSRPARAVHRNLTQKQNKEEEMGVVFLSISMDKILIC